MLKPRERDLFLSVVDLLASNVTTLHARVITSGYLMKACRMSPRVGLM